MSDSGRLHHIALGGILGALVLWASVALGQDTTHPTQGQENGQETGQEHRDNGTNQRPEKPIGTAPDDATLPGKLPRQHRDSNQRSEEDQVSDNPANTAGPIYIFGDTHAQWVMALSGLAAVVISIVAVGLLYKTLTATRGTMKEARQSTRAARDAVTATQNIAVQQLRAYVNITHAEAGFEGGGMIKMKLTVMNTGQTPARGLTYSSGYQTGGDAPIGPEARDQNVPSIDLGANVEVTFTFRSYALDDERWTLIRSKKIPLHVFGTIKYHDVFEIERQTAFRLRLSEGNLLLPTTEGNTST